MALKFDASLAEGVEDGIRWVTKTAPLYGAVNGYVQLPAGHPWRDLSLQMGDGDVDVHGGVTYGPDENGWIGFDTIHAWDVWPGSPEYMPNDPANHRWTAAEVADEARGLAKQAARALDTKKEV